MSPPKLTMNGTLRKVSGAPSKLNDKLVREFIQALERGHYSDTAAELVGVSPYTIEAWLRKGERMWAKLHQLEEQLQQAQAAGKRKEAESLEEEVEAVREHPLLNFVQSVKNAQAKAINDALEVIRRRERNWQAAAWFLERKFPDRFGQRQRHEVTGSGGGPVQVASVDLSKLTVEELRKLRDILRKVSDSEA